MILVDEKKMEWFHDMSVKDVLDRMEHTEFCAVIRLNGSLVSSPFFQTTRVPDNAEIHLLPLVAGG